MSNIIKSCIRQKHGGVMPCSYIFNILEKKSKCIATVMLQEKKMCI